MSDFVEEYPEEEYPEEELPTDEPQKDEEKINPFALTPSCKAAARIRLAEQVDDFIRRGGQVLELPPDTSSAGSLIF